MRFPKPKSAQGKYPMIDGVQYGPDDREICLTGTAAGKREYERRTYEMAHRQGNICPWCHQSMLRPTFDHEAGRGMGGGIKDERLTHEDGTWRNAAMCSACNGLKGSRRFSWVDGRYQEVA